MRALIGKTFYSGLGIEEDDIFVSDGAKCDITRLQVWFVLVWKKIHLLNLSIFNVFVFFFSPLMLIIKLS